MMPFAKISPLVLLHFCLFVSSLSGNTSLSPTTVPVRQQQNATTPRIRPSMSPISNFSAFPNATELPSSLATVVTSVPTESPAPTQFPSTSKAPTAVPSEIPSTVPTLEMNSSDRTVFRQKFVVNPDKAFFNETFFVQVVEGYTARFAPLPERLPYITTNCSIKLQSSTMTGNETINEVDYTVSYFSMSTDVSNFTVLYADYVNSNLSQFASDLQDVSLDLLEAKEVIETQMQSPAPSISPGPTISPTGRPSVTPSESPNGEQPTFLPTMDELPFPPTSSPVPEHKKLLGVGAISAIVVMGGLSVLAMLLCYYFSWKKKQRNRLTGSIPSSSSGPYEMRPNSQRTDGVWPTSRREGAEEPNHDLALSPTESVETNKSLISAGESGLSDESCDEEDRTKDLLDEFDKYKDQNLEQFRDGVEHTVTGMEGVMSAAVTMAHMIDDGAMPDESELRWGCDQFCAGIDIEASALFEVSDWLKRNENTPPERRRAFMEEILNKMVTSVKNGVLNADDGSRTIHESAAILGLQLAESLPTTTVVISGMRLTASAEDLAEALREFGDVEVAAVASGSRGFGIVRFRRSKSIERAMQRYSTGEIIIQDVAVQMKVLMAFGIVDSRAPEIVE